MARRLHAIAGATGVRRRSGSSRLSRPGPPRRGPTLRTDTSVIDTVAASVRDAIVRGVYHSGERLNQSRLAAELGVSRIPVREALRQLEAEGLVSFDHNQGTRVARLAPEDVQDIFEMRIELEVLALRTAIARATPQHVETARRLLDRMDRLEDDPEQWLRFNNRFHTTLYAPGQRRYLLRIIQTLRHAVEPYLRLYLMALRRFEVAQVQHRKILDAYARRDTMGARSALGEHLLHTMQELLRALGRPRHPMRPWP